MSETNTSGERQIKINEVKPGMTIRWETGGITHECEVEAATPSLASGAVDLDAVGGGYMRIERATLVTVLSEPAPAQPEEPTALGARVVVGEHRFILVDNDSTPWLNMNTWMWYSWGELCNMGTVTVIDADPCWTAPADREPTPEVPERIEEWPEYDEHLRAYSWRDHDGDTWGWLNDEAEWECRSSVDIRLGTSRRPDSGYGPWTRITDS